MFRIEDGRFTPFPLFAETVRMEMDMSDMRIMLTLLTPNRFIACCGSVI